MNLQEDAGCHLCLQEEFDHHYLFDRPNQRKMYSVAMVSGHHVLLVVSSRLCLLDPSTRQKLLQVAEYCGLLN